MPDQINKLAKLSAVDGMDPSFAAHYSQLTDAVNSLAGHNGPIPLQNHVNMLGNKVQNVGVPTAPTDVLSSGVAAKSYSAAALKPQLSPGGSQSMSGYRQLNSRTQREQQSSWLNDLMSSVPNANGILPTLQNVGGGVQVTIPAERFTFADGSNLMLQARTDILGLPTSFAISSIAAVANLVTVHTSATGLVAGDVMTVVGVTPLGFNGAFILESSSGGGAVLTYEDNIGTVGGSGGFVELSNIYYYAVKKNNSNLYLLGPFNGDTAQNRLQANFDGLQIVAVISLTASGGQVSQTGGGGSPLIGSPAAGSFF